MILPDFLLKFIQSDKKIQVIVLVYPRLKLNKVNFQYNRNIPFTK